MNNNLTVQPLNWLCSFPNAFCILDVGLPSYVQCNSAPPILQSSSINSFFSCVRFVRRTVTVWSVSIILNVKSKDIALDNQVRRHATAGQMPSH